MVYRLKYNSKEEAQQDLLQRGILMEVEGKLVKAERTHAIVYVGQIVDKAATYDEQGNELTAPIFIDGYHVDLMLKNEEDFGAYQVNPSTPSHKFGGQ